MQELKEYLDYLRVQRNLSPATLDAYERDLTHFLNFVMEQLDLLGREQTLQEVDKYLVREYLAFLTREGYARSSLARRLASIRGFSRFLFSSGRLERDFAAQVGTPKQPKTVPETMTMDEIKAVLERMQAHQLQARNRRSFEVLPQDQAFR